MIEVLIVDDSEPIRERLAVLLAESGQIRIVGQVGTSADGWEAVQRLKPDTVILDIRLPDCTGIALLKKIKAHYPRMKVIMLTNFDARPYRRQCRLLGADHFLNKTLEFEKVVASVTGSPAPGGTAHRLL
jgi:DNA-binding NarL/FixJ family response regulator